MRLASLAACFCLGGLLCGAPAVAQSRGELLYTTHCVACHTTGVHWRDHRLATDWNSLQAQVARWQGIGFLAWSDDDIAAVTRYLNESYYGFQAPRDAPVVLTPAAKTCKGSRC
ncbi:MAG: cytochrome C [Variovorax sp.]|nr:cytochrome C [Variovorax sp.]